VIKPGYCAANSLQIWSGKPFGGGQELLRVEKGEAAQPGATWRKLDQVGSIVEQFCFMISLQFT
jgi:hypothetical protein